MRVFKNEYKFIAIMPLAIISMLLLSLFESLFILPCHLAHTNLNKQPGLYTRMRSAVDKAIEFLIYRIYRQTRSCLFTNTNANRASKSSNYWCARKPINHSVLTAATRKSSES